MYFLIISKFPLRKGYVMVVFVCWAFVQTYIGMNMGTVIHLLGTYEVILQGHPYAPQGTVLCLKYWAAAYWGMHEDRECMLIMYNNIVSAI